MSVREGMLPPSSLGGGGGGGVGTAFESVQFACVSATITTSPFALQSPPHVLYFELLFVITYVPGVALNVIFVPVAVTLPDLLDAPCFFMVSLTLEGGEPSTLTTVIFTVPTGVAACAFCTSAARTSAENANNAMRAPAIRTVCADSPMLAGFPPRAFRISVSVPC